MKVILDYTPQFYNETIDCPIIWLDKDGSIRVSARLINYCDTYYNRVLESIRMAEEQRNICGNCDWFKQYGVMGFDGCSEICTAQGKFNMKSKRWDDKGCNRFKRS